MYSKNSMAAVKFPNVLFTFCQLKNLYLKNFTLAVKFPNCSTKLPEVVSTLSQLKKCIYRILCWQSSSRTARSSRKSSSVLPWLGVAESSGHHQERRPWLASCREMAPERVFQVLDHFCDFCDIFWHVFKTYLWTNW
jgi:hypothetical protein